MMPWILNNNNSAKVLWFLFEKEMHQKSLSNSKSLKSYPSGRNFEGFLILFFKMISIQKKNANYDMVL